MFSGGWQKLAMIGAMIAVFAKTFNDRLPRSDQSSILVYLGLAAILLWVLVSFRYQPEQKLRNRKVLGHLPKMERRLFWIDLVSITFLVMAFGIAIGLGLAENPTGWLLVTIIAAPALVLLLASAIYQIMRPFPPSETDQPG